MAKLGDQMPLVVIFHDRTGSIFQSMRSRFAGKTNKNGRVIRHARLLPFTLAEFRAWLLEKLGGKPEGSVPCVYCNAPLCADTVKIDHPDPVSRGGSLGFENLACSCDRCNRMKGSLTAAEFEAVKIALGNLLNQGKLHPAGFSDIEKRLCGQVAIFKRQFFSKQAKPEESGVLVEKTEQIRLLTKPVSHADNSW